MEIIRSFIEMIPALAAVGIPVGAVVAMSVAAEFGGRAERRRIGADAARKIVEVR